MANDLFRIPIQHDDDIRPVNGLDHHLGHVNPPPLMRSCRAGLLRPGVRVAFSLWFGLTRSPWACINRNTRFLLISALSTNRRWAQMRRYPQNGCSAFRAWMRCTTDAVRFARVSEARRVMTTPTRRFFLGLKGQFPDQILKPGILALQTSFAIHLLEDLKCLRRVHKKDIPPLVILALSDLIALTNRFHRLTFEALKDDDGFSLRVPLISFHGCSLLGGSATVYLVRVSLTRERTGTKYSVC